MNRTELKNYIGIECISTLTAVALCTNITFDYKTGENVTITIKDDPYYIGHKDLVDEAIDEYLIREYSKIRSKKIDSLLNEC